MENNELRRFKSFVESPYFNKNTKLIRLVGYISRFHPQFDSPNFTERNAHLHTLPDSPYKEGAVAKLASKLFKLLVDFFSAEEMRQAGFRKDFNLLVEYRKRGLMTDFERLSSNMKKQQRNQERPRPEIFHDRFLLEREINRVESTKKDKGVGDVNFGLASAALDNYYLYHKLIYTCQRINRGNVVKGLGTEDPFPHILRSLPALENTSEPILQIWLEAFQMLSGEDKRPHYKNLKAKLMSGELEMDGEQSRILFTYLENTAIRIFPARRTMYRELYSLYEYQRGIGVFLHKDVGVFEVMGNYIATAVNLGKIKRARAFLDMAAGQLDAEHEGVYQFCDAMVLFEEGKYGDTLDRLNGLPLQSIFIKLAEKRIRLKVYYELEYGEPLYDHINSFRVFLSNNKDNINDRLLRANRQFVIHLRRLLQWEFATDKEREEYLSELRKDRDSMEKTWISKKFKALIH